jgi:hypothetical protein
MASASRRRKSPIGRGSLRPRRPRRRRQPRTEVVMTALLLLLTCIFSTAIPVQAVTGFEDITVTVTTDKTYYQPGEPVEISVSECNLTPGPVTIHYACGCCHDDLRVLDANNSAIFDCPLIGGCLPASLDITWQPGECRVNSYTWDQSADPFCGVGDPVAAGRYKAWHRWRFTDYARITLSDELVIGEVPAVPVTSWWGLAVLALLLGASGLSKCLANREEAVAAVEMRRLGRRSHRRWMRA